MECLNVRDGLILRLCEFANYKRGSLVLDLNIVARFSLKKGAALTYDEPSPLHCITYAALPFDDSDIVAVWRKCPNCFIHCGLSELSPRWDTYLGLSSYKDI